MPSRNFPPDLPLFARHALYGIFFFATLLSVACGEDIFREAEEADDTNMTTEGPYRPQTPEESTKLSGRRWLNGKVADAPLFAEYDLNVTTAGSYHFFIRKFWQHGAFQWRVDNGDWEQMRKCSLLDSVVMREYVPLNWVSLGDVDLAAGSHKLRIEVVRDPSYQYSDAFGFDCFLLTQGELRDFLASHSGNGEVK